MAVDPKYCPNCARPLELREHGGKERLACPDPGCGFVVWGNPIPVVAAIVEHEATHVVLVQNKGWPENWWGIVTGFLESEEDPADAVLRELREELGLAGEIVALIGVYGFADMNQVIIAYHVRAAGEIAVGDELAGFKRVPIEKLRPWQFGTGQAVKDWLSKRT